MIEKLRKTAIVVKLHCKTEKKLRKEKGGGFQRTSAA